MFLWIIQRDLLLAMRRRSDVLTTLFFFIIVVSLFPLGVGPEMDMLRNMAPGVLWVAALLASMLSLARLFAADHLDGTLEQMCSRRSRWPCWCWARCWPTGWYPGCRWC